jgi:hypothetical protein
MDNEALVALVVAAGSAVGFVMTGVAGAVSAGVSYLFNAFRDRRAREADEESERRLHALEDQLERGRVQFSELHERRAVVIAELYRRLRAVEREARMFDGMGLRVARVFGDDTIKANYHRAMKAVFDLKYYAEDHAIYFRPEVMTDIEKACDTSSTVINLGSADHAMGAPLPDFSLQRLGPEFFRARAALETEFRELLGVTPRFQPPASVDASARPLE